MPAIRWNRAAILLRTIVDDRTDGGEVDVDATTDRRTAFVRQPSRSGTPVAAAIAIARTAPSAPIGAPAARSPPPTAARSGSDPQGRGRRLIVAGSRDGNHWHLGCTWARPRVRHWRAREVRFQSAGRGGLEDRWNAQRPSRLLRPPRQNPSRRLYIPARVQANRIPSSLL